MTETVIIILIAGVIVVAGLYLATKLFSNTEKAGEDKQNSVDAKAATAAQEKVDAVPYADDTAVDDSLQQHKF